jgi:excinuclease ABC subunit C
VRVPERGEKKAALDTVEKNAKEALVQHKLKRSSDLTTRSQALKEIQEHLGLPDAPLRIECIDISHTQGSNVVASLVVFEDGLAKKRDYRHFAIHGEAAADDTASMYDVVSRRFSRYLEQMSSDEPDDRFGYRPSLLVVDGAGPQVAAATKALTDLGLVDISVVGLAKRLEEIWVPDDPFPVILPRNSEGLFLMQRLRDEAHRFAITYHRSKRAKAMTSSVLDDISGLGESKRTALLRHFGSVKKVRAATADEICEVKGIGPALAAKIVAALAD